MRVFRDPKNHGSMNKEVIPGITARLSPPRLRYIVSSSSSRPCVSLSLSYLFSISYTITLHVCAARDRPCPTSRLSRMRLGTSRAHMLEFNKRRCIYIYMYTCIVPRPWIFVPKLCTRERVAKEFCSSSITAESVRFRADVKSVKESIYIIL